MATIIPQPDRRELLTPLLPALPTAAFSTQAAPAILRILSPILRQRVQLFSATSSEPWLKFLTYDKGKEARLAEVARGDRLEPHPVSGEVEVDWDYDVQTQYKRLDEETLQALLILEDFDLFFRLVYCVNDEAGGGDGWRVGEVSVPEKSNPFASFAGYTSIEEAEIAFKQKDSNTAFSSLQVPNTTSHVAPQDEEEDDDDDYWARYDATPARTPQVKESPAPQSTQYIQSQQNISEEDDAYYAQYDNVQPAMDNHDPDEAQVAEQFAAPPPPLGLQYPTELVKTTATGDDVNDTNSAWSFAPTPSARSQEDEERTAALAHPRPASSASSNGSNMVLKLEQQAGMQEQSEFGIKQHISRSIRSLFLLSRSTGIDREEFERMIKMELDVLGMVEDTI